MFAFEIVGFAMVALFFGALVNSGNSRSTR
jgi:hypothetical protein